MASAQLVRAISQKLQELFDDLINHKVKEFKVMNEELLPDGLKPHTRSICWLAEQVILQNTKKNQDAYGLTRFEYPDSDIAPWDVRFRVAGIDDSKDIYVNIKVSDATRPVRRNDIASVKTLLNFFRNTNDPIIFFVVFKLRFNNVRIVFEAPTIVRFYPWIREFVVNPRNEHIQAIYEVPIVEQSLDAFIALLKEKAEDKGLNIP